MQKAIYAMSEIRRELVTLAFVGQEIGRTQDFLSALRPLFVPIAQDLQGEFFDAAQLKRDLEVRYGISVPEDVCAFLTGRLHTQGLLSREAETATSALFRWKVPSDIPVYDSEDVHEALDALVAELVTFRNQFPSLVFNEFEGGDLLAIFLEYLKTTDNAMAGVVQAGASEAPSITIAGKKIFRDEKGYFCAKFLEYLAAANPGVMQWVSRLSTAALVSEVVLSLKEPPTRNFSLNGAVYYLDAPFLLELLGSSGKDRKDNARYTAEKISKAGALLRVLDHSVEEALQALVALRGKEASQRRGPTHAAMLRGEVTAMFLDSLIAEIEFHIEQAGVQVIDTGAPRFSPAQIATFSEQKRQELEGRLIGAYSNPRAAERDAMSVAFVLRSRGRTKARRIHEAKHLLLTRNDTLNGYVSQFLKQSNLLDVGEIGPILLSDHVTAFIWLSAGDQDRVEIDVRHLLIQSDRMVQASPAAIDALKANLARVSPGNLETFEALMQVPRCYQFALDLVSGSVPRAMSANAEEVFERVRRETAAEETAKHRESMKKVRERHDAKTKVLETKIGATEQEKAEVERQKEVLARQLISRSEDDQRRADNIFDSVASARHKTLYWSKVLFSWVLLAWLAISLRELLERAEDLAHHRQGLALTTGAIALASLWFGEKFWIKWFDGIWRGHLRSRTKDAGVVGLVDEREFPSD